MFYTVNMLNAYCKLGEKFDDQPVRDKKLTGGPKLQLASIAVDTFVSLSALVIGIVGLLGILNGMPPAAAYTLIAISGLITISWIGSAITTKGGVFRAAADLIKAAFSSDPATILC